MPMGLSSFFQIPGRRADGGNANKPNFTSSSQGKRGRVRTKEHPKGPRGQWTPRQASPLSNWPGSGRLSRKPPNTGTLCWFLDDFLRRIFSKQAFNSNPFPVCEQCVSQEPRVSRWRRGLGEASESTPSVPLSQLLRHRHTHSH